MADYFPRIDSNEMARSAIKMSGLPVFLAGGSMIFQAGFGLIYSYGMATPPVTLWIACAIVSALGAALIFASLQLRKGKGMAGLVFLAFVLSILNVVSVVFSFGLFTLKSRIIMATVPALLALLTIHGIRGWLWLKRNQKIG